MFAADNFGQSRRYHLYWRVAERKGQIWTLVAYAAFGICWLLPLAWLCLIYAQLNILMLVLAVLPMGIAAKFFNADILSPDED
jgi:hypothetical protein